MKIDLEKMSNVHGYMEGSAEAADQADALTAIGYKKEIARNYISITPDQIDARLGGSDYYVTRKYDGEMSVLFFDGEQAAIINRSGRIRTGLPCTEDAKAALIAAGVRQAVIPAELYVDETAGRTRVFHVLNALSDQKKIDSLRLAAFDILQLDDEPFKAMSYGQTHDKLAELFASATLVTPVLSKPCGSKAGVKEIYADWVDGQGAEGLVVRTELPLVYKVKPRHTIDVAVVGYSEGSGDQAGQVRSLLFAMMGSKDEFQVIGKAGTGMSEELKTELLGRLSEMVVDSQYIETDSNRVAFRMVRPEIVIEVMINDVLFDTATGYIDNAVLSFEQGAYRHLGTVHGISVVSPVFVRFRDDKKAVHDDIRLSQISDFSFVPDAPVVSEAGSAKSELLKRVVYKKQLGTKLMVQKFMVWKTNKPAPDYAGYVFHYTNFSSERKDPLQREVMVSDDEDQIMALCDASIETNVKKGWTAVE